MSRAHPDGHLHGGQSAAFLVVVEAIEKGVGVVEVDFGLGRAKIFHQFDGALAAEKWGKLKFKKLNFIKKYA